MFWEGRRGNRCVRDQTEILGRSSTLSSGHCWAPASSGESQKLLRLGCGRKQTSPMERKGSHRVAVWCYLRPGPKPPADRFLWGQGSWQDEKGLRVSSGLSGHMGRWAGGFSSPSQVNRASSVASSPLLRVPVSCPPSFGVLSTEGGRALYRKDQSKQ